MVLFHILDALAQDLRVENETETTREVQFLEAGGYDSDEDRMREVKGGYSSLQMVIQLFGTTPEGKAIRALITGFEPFFFVQLPQMNPAVKRGFVTAIGDKIREAKIRASPLRSKVLATKALFEKATGREEKAAAKKELSRLEEDLRRYEKVSKLEGCFDVSYEMRQVLFGYTGGKEFPFARIRVRSLASFRAMKSLFLDEGNHPIFPTRETAYPVHEATLDPMLRFFHLRDIQPCGWVSIEEEPEEGEGFLSLETDWEEVSPVAKPPMAAAPFLMAAWDIECYSTTGDFPVPQKDPVIQIGVVLVKQGAPTEKHIFVLDTCEEVPGAIVHAYKDERGMILGWAAAMRKWNPDILMGYNIFGFDEKYLWQRAEKLKIEKHSDLQALTRLLDLEKEMKLETKFLSSSALGDNTMYIWTAHGRLQVDLYHYVKRSFSLPSYKLDDVCRHFMSGKLKGVDPAVSEGRWALKTSSTSDVIAGRYVVLLDETGDTVVDKLRIVEVRKGEALIVDAPVGDDVEDLIASLPDAVKWAVVKDDVSPQEIFKLQRGNAADRARIAAYCIQDCDLTVELYKKLDVFNNAMAMANACSVPVSYIFTRGQGIKIESLIFKECYQRKQSVCVLGQPRRRAVEDEEGGPTEEESYEGAIVLDPNPGFYFDSPVGVADFASLYPSTIISENISHDTLVWVKDFDVSGKFVGYSYGSAAAESYATEGVAWTDIGFDIWGSDPQDTRKHPTKIKTGYRICRYAQLPNEARGTLPDIVAKLLAARKAKRKEAEKENDPFKKALLDAEQLAYKLTANSLYGQLGSSTFKVRLQHLAASVTAYGRKQILFAKAAIEKFYGHEAQDPRCSAEIVYGDTDSLFVNFHVRNPETGLPLEGKAAIEATMHLTEEAGKMVSSCLKAPHDFEYDKVFYPFIIFSKKRYVGNKYEESPEDYSQTSMGIATKRRDYAPIVKVVYGGAIRILLTEKNIEKAVAFVKEKTMELAEGRTSMNQLTMTKSLRAEYKAATPPAHKILANRIAERDPGNAPASGERIAFVYISPPPGQMASKLQGDRVETPTYIREKGLKPDAQFYIEHQLMNPIRQLFSLCVEAIPGYVKPKEGWNEDPVKAAIQKESLAAELIFGDSLKRCARESVRQFGAKFGITVEAKGPSKAKTVVLTTPESVSPAPKKQGTLNSFFVDRFLIQKMEEASAKAKKKKEEATPEPSPKAEAAPKKRAPKKTGKTVEILA